MIRSRSETIKAISNEGAAYLVAFLCEYFEQKRPGVWKCQSLHAGRRCCCGELTIKGPGYLNLWKCSESNKTGNLFNLIHALEPQANFYSIIDTIAQEVGGGIIDSIERFESVKPSGAEYLPKNYAHLRYNSRLANVKPYLEPFLRTITLETAKHEYLCPIGNGKHTLRTGLFSDFPALWCDEWNCETCGKGGNILDLAALYYNSSNLFALQMLENMIIQPVQYIKDK